MYKFLTSFLLIIFAAHNFTSGQDVPDKISTAIKNDYPNIQIRLDVILTKPQEIDSLLQQKYISKNTIPNQTEDNLVTKSSDSSKIEAFNTKSEKPVRQVSTAGVEHSPVLIVCAQTIDGCSETKQVLSPTPITTITPTPTPFSPSPEPIPDPPKPSPGCKYDLNCKMIACADLRTENIQNICECPCVPPPIY